MSLVVAVIASAALAFGVGRAVYAHEVQASAAERASYDKVEAVLRTDATPDHRDRYHSGPAPHARVEWRSNGDWVGREVPVPEGSRVGDEVTVWLGPNGEVVNGPPWPGEGAMAVATVVLLGCGGATWLIFRLARWGIDVRRSAWWEAEWARIAPQWTRGSPP